MPSRPLRQLASVRLRPGLARLDRPALLVSIAIGLAAICLGVVVVGVRMRTVRQPEPEAERAAPPQATAVASPADAASPAEPSGAEAAAPAGPPGEAPASTARSGTGRSTFAAEKFGDQGVAQYGAIARSWRDPAPLMAQLASGPHPPPSVVARLPRVVVAVPSSALGFAWPMRGSITSAFDDDHPLGIDIAPWDALGLIVAARDGRVLIAGGDPCCSYGYFVLLDHGDGLTSIYGHFRDPPAVRAGEWVERGTVLGVAGDTGHSFGVHLHFEVRLNGVPVDPQLVLTAGFLNPLLSRMPAPSPAPATEAPPDLHAGEPGSQRGEGDTPADPTGDAEGIAGLTEATPEQAPTRGSAGSSPSPAPSPAPTASASPTATVAPAPSIAPTPAASPRATPSAVPSIAARSSPAPVATASPPMTSAASRPPSPVPSSIMSNLTPSPAASATTSPTPSADPSPPASPTPTPSPTPVPCATLRHQPGGAPPLVIGAAAPFIGLDLERGRVGSLVAERCGADGTIRITAEPLAGERCSAGLYAAPDRLVRALMPTAAASPSQVVRWTVESSDLSPGAIVRLACSPESERDGS